MAQQSPKRFPSFRLPMNIRLTRYPLVDRDQKQNVAQNPLLLEILEILQVMNERIEERAKDSIAYNFMDDKELEANNTAHVFANQHDNKSTHWDRTNEYARSIMRLKALLDGEEQRPVLNETRDVDLYSLSNYSQAERQASQFNLAGNLGRWVEPTPPASPSSDYQAAPAPSIEAVASSVAGETNMKDSEGNNAHATTVWSFSSDEEDLENEVDTQHGIAHNEREPNLDQKGKGMAEGTRQVEPLSITKVSSPPAMPKLSFNSSRNTIASQQTLPARPLPERISNPRAEVSFHAYSSWKRGIVDRVRNLLPGKDWHQSGNHSFSVGTEKEQKQQGGIFSQIRRLVVGFGRFEVDVVRIVS